MCRFSPALRSPSPPAALRRLGWLESSRALSVSQEWLPRGGLVPRCLFPLAPFQAPSWTLLPSGRVPASPCRARQIGRCLNRLSAAQSYLQEDGARVGAAL